MKCSVKDCENHSHQGYFVGLLCEPCHDFIAGGSSIYSQAYRNMRSMIDAAVAKDREACASLCEHVAETNEKDGAWLWEARKCAAIIRERADQ